MCGASSSADCQPPPPSSTIKSCKQEPSSPPSAAADISEIGFAQFHVTLDRSCKPCRYLLAACSQMPIGPCMRMALPPTCPMWRQRVERKLLPWSKGLRWGYSARTSAKPIGEGNNQQGHTGAPTESGIRNHSCGTD